MKLLSSNGQLATCSAKKSLKYLLLKWLNEVETVDALCPWRLAPRSSILTCSVVNWFWILHLDPSGKYITLEVILKQESTMRINEFIYILDPSNSKTGPSSKRQPLLTAEWVSSVVTGHIFWLGQPTSNP